MSRCYVDTSALAKWYISEPGSEAFESFVADVDAAVVSALTVTEMRCLLARRRRAGDFDHGYEKAAFERFQGDLVAGHLRMCACHDQHFIDAASLIDRLDPLPLQTLDAVHLAVALAADVETLATADDVMARAAAPLGLVVRFFGGD